MAANIASPVFLPARDRFKRFIPQRSACDDESFQAWTGAIASLEARARGRSCAICRAGSLEDLGADRAQPGKDAGLPTSWQKHDFAVPERRKLLASGHAVPMTM